MNGYVILTFFILLAACSGNIYNSTNKETMLTIRGKITFRGGAPNSIPDGSILTVKFQDTNRMDAPAIGLGTMVQKINGYKKGDSITYEIKTNNRPKLGMPGSVSFQNLFI